MKDVYFRQFISYGCCTLPVSIWQHAATARHPSLHVQLTPPTPTCFSVCLPADPATHVLQNSAQPINVADVLTKLMQHLEPAVAAPLWQQYRAGAAGGSSDGAAAAPSQAGPVAPGAPNPAHAKVNRTKFAANSNKCGVCGETYHSSFSPLVLCDFCPGAYHVCCLGLDWADLPEAEWACNK